MSLTNQQYREIYKKLSQKKREVIASPEFDEVVDKIFKKNSLDREKSLKLGFIIKDILYEILDQNNSEVEIKNKLKIDDSLAKKINLDIRDIADNIENIHETIYSEKLNQESFSKKEIDLEKVNWRDRINEISKKYGLNDSQKNKLEMVCEEVSKNIYQKGTLLSSLGQKLSISKILAEQIIEDLDKRIFDYAINSTQEKKIDNHIPEIRPQNLPVVEKTSTQQPAEQKISTPRYTQEYRPVSSSNTTTNNYKPITKPEETAPKKEDDWLSDLAEKPFIGKDFGGSKITYKSTSQEIVQKPTSVPRLNLDQTVEPTKQPQSAQSIIENKLNNSTSSTIQPTETKQEVPKKYGVDPYREPIE